MRRRSLDRRLRLTGARFLLFRPSWGWALGVLRSFLTSFAALAVSLKLLPGTQVTRGALSVAGLAIGVLVLGALLRPLLTRLTVLTGVVGLLLTGVLAQALILFAALELVPTVHPARFQDVVLASYGAAIASAVVNWLLDTSSDEVFLGQLLGRAARSTLSAGSAGPGLLVVQLDGVSEPVLRQAIASGAVPTISRWVRSGSHQLRRWHTGVPATTPAGQAVLLHGDVTSVPGYRWYDKAAGQARAVSHFADAAAVQKQISDGRGLLADGGASISNLFSGDAPTRLLTVSDGHPAAFDDGAARFATLRFGLLRSLTLFVGQMITEAYQGRRQRIRDVVPRVHRGGAFVVLRGVTTVVLRDVAVAMIAEQLTRGTPVVYVDFVDYDEVAHHAGPTRPESMRTLESLDLVLSFLDRLACEVGRRYEIAVVSDHGQTQGATFLQLAGRTLADVVRELAPETGAVEPTGTDEHERSMPAGMLLAGVAGPARSVARAATALAHRRDRQPADGQDSPLLVVCSGSLAHLYRSDLPGRLTREQVDELHPRLVAGLAAHPQVGVVMTRRADGAVVLDGAGGCLVMRGTDDGVEQVSLTGLDPLTPYGSEARADLVQLDQRDHVGDVVVLGRFDPVLGEVVAFEELVGSHGGMGGPQTEAFLVHPTSWQVQAGRLSGRDVHAAMVARLAALGLRRS